jgi:transcriptional regulator with XRE-family HTH domain
MALLNELLHQQQVEGLSDGDFARKLGITRHYWSAIKNGHQPITIKVLRAVVRTYPGLGKQVISYLAGESAGTQQAAA